MVLHDRNYKHHVKYSDFEKDSPEQIKAILWFNAEERWRRRTLTDEEQTRRLDQIATMVRGVGLKKELPKYKGSARPLSDRETKMLDRRRKEIDKAMGELSGSRAEETRGALQTVRETKQQDNPESPDYISDRQLALMDDAALGEFMAPYVEGRGGLQDVRDELCTRIARLALSPLPVDEDEFKRLADIRNSGGQAKMLADYHDFMNEERRLILRTIKGANAKKLENTATTESWNIVPATKQELDAFLEADALEDYTAYFDGKRELVRANAGQAFEAMTSDKWRSCAGFAPTSFDDVVDVAGSLRGTEEEAKAWCLQLRDHKDHGLRNTRLETFGGDRPRPCKRWPFPFDFRTKTPLEGYWSALKRMVDVKNELGLGARLNPWKYAAAYHADPLIATSQKGNVIGPVSSTTPNAIEVVVDGSRRKKINSDMCLMIQLFRKYGGETKAQGTNAFGTQILEIELLRCYPEPQPEDSRTINSILAFVCWWHKTITTNDEAMRNLYEQNNPGKTVSDTQIQAEKRRAVYDLMCCPDCMYKSGDLLQGATPKWANGARSAVQTRVGELVNFMKTLKEALDTDVFQTPREQSVLWRGGCLWHDAKAKLDKLYEPHAQLAGLKKQARMTNRQATVKRRALAKAREAEQELLGYVREKEVEYEKARAEAKVLNERLDALDDGDEREAAEVLTRRADNHEMDVAEELEMLQSRHAEKETEAVKLAAEVTVSEDDARNIASEIGTLESAMAPEDIAAIQQAQDDLYAAVHPSPDDERRGREVYRQWLDMNPLVN